MHPKRFKENFDFESNDGLTGYANPLLENWIDPSHIGRKVILDFTGSVTRRTYTLDTYEADLAKMDTWSPINVADIGAKIKGLANDLWNSGVTKFLDDNGRAIAYGTDGGDTITAQANTAYFNSYQFPAIINNGVVLFGGKSNDVLTGGSKGDSLDGGIGDDRLDGGVGNDILNGGADKDTYIVSAGNDIINDAGSGDVIQSYTGTAVETETDSGIYKLGGADITRSGDSLIITHDNGTTTLTDWVKGDYGNAANDNDVLIFDLMVA